MSKLPWFRTYTRMVDDDKLKLLAFEDRWHFVALLCLKGEGLLDKGDAPSLLMRKVTVTLRLRLRQAKPGRPEKPRLEHACAKRLPPARPTPKRPACWRCLRPSCSASMWPS